MEKIIKQVLKKMGLDKIKTSKNNLISSNYAPMQASALETPQNKDLVKTEDNLDYYSTPIGNYYLPGDAPNDIVINHMKEGKYFEEEVIETAKKLIKKDSIVLDIGSNFGQMAIFFSHLVGDEGIVYAFEADDFVFEVLKKNIEANNCKNIVPVFGAVYNQTGKELLFPKQDFQRFLAYGSYGIDPMAKEGRIVRSLQIDDINFEKAISFFPLY